MRTSPSQARPPLRRAILLVPVIGGTCLVLIAVVLVIVLVVRRAAGLPTEHNPGMPLEVTRAAPSAATVTPGPEGGPGEEACIVSVSSGDAQQPVPLPVSLTIGSRVFPVVATLPSEGRWDFPEGYPGAAAWVCGSVVNYLLQLEATSDNRALLESVQTGGSLTLRLSNGTDLRFRVGERREVKAYDASTVAQARPSLTLILPLGDDAWQIVMADHYDRDGRLVNYAEAHGVAYSHIPVFAPTMELTYDFMNDRYVASGLDNQAPPPVYDRPMPESAFTREGLLPPRRVRP